MTLSAQGFASAVSYLKQHGRPLEVALYGHLFEGADAEPAVRALAAYQNADGGFGNALEPDLRLPDSSVIATTIGFQNFRTLGLGAAHPMVAAACRYLNEQYRPAEMRWIAMPAHIDDAPHAPWWQVGGGTWNSRANPTAEILGFLYEYPQHFDATMRDALTAALAGYLDSQDDELEMHDLLCFVSLIENPAVPEAVKLKFLPKLKRVAENTVERSPEKWPQYTLPPLGIIYTPDSPFVSLFANELPANFEFLLSWRGEDGGWHPNWSWGDDPLASQVTREWSSVLTFSNLRKLRAFGMIEGV